MRTHHKRRRVGMIRWPSILALLLLMLAACVTMAPIVRRPLHEFLVTVRLKRVGAEVHWHWRRLSVDTVFIDDVALTQDIVSSLSELHDLRCVAVSVKSREATAVALTRVSQLAGLREVVVSGRIRDQEVYKLSGPDSLEVISFDFTDVSDDGLRHLARFPRLRTVRVYGSRVTAAGVEELKEAVPNVDVGWKKHRLIEDRY